MAGQYVWNPSNGNITYKVRFLYPFQEEMIDIRTSQMAKTVGGTNANIGLGHNRSNGNDAIALAGLYGYASPYGVTLEAAISAQYADIPHLGIHDFFIVENGNGIAYGHRPSTSETCAEFALIGSINC